MTIRLRRAKDPLEPDEAQLVLRALADPTRRKILLDLDTIVGVPIAYLEEEIPMTRQALHKHLGVLVRAGLVIKSCRGAAMIYYMDPRPIRRVFANLARRYKRDVRTIDNLYKFGSPDLPWE